MLISSFKNSTIAVLVSLSLCNSTKAQTTYNPLAPALGFNVFTSRDLKAKAGDTQGPVAIGGGLAFRWSNRICH